VVAIGLGSGLYHLAPSDATLVFDWIPIVVALMWLVSLIVADRVDRRLAVAAAVVLPLLAVASVLAWYTSGGTAGGDMRWYGLVQLEGVLLVPLLLLAYPRGVLRSRELWAALACFGAMRGLATFDAAILDATGVVSGHSLKHVVAAVAAYLAMRSLRTATAAAPATSVRPVLQPFVLGERPAAKRGP